MYLKDSFRIEGGREVSFAGGRNKPLMMMQDSPGLKAVVGSVRFTF